MKRNDPPYDILIVDDEPKNLTVLREMLVKEGFTVRPALSGALALHAVEAKQPDLVLLDIMMPDMDGYEVCRQIKDRPEHAAIPVLFISALDDTKDKVRAFEAGGQDYISKPFQFQEVLARVRTHLRLRDLQTALEAQNKQLRLEITARERAQAALAEANASLQTANQELDRLARQDFLTGLANRRLFDDFLEREWKRLAREREPLALVFMDIDFFKQFNDTYGHSQGDTCLKRVAQAISRSLKRPADLAARYGGEEFAVVLPGTDAKGAQEVAETIRHRIAGLAIPHSGSQAAAHVTISLGIAVVTPEAVGGGEDAKAENEDGGMSSGVASLIQAADAALYEAKTSGRNRTCCAAVSD